MPHTSLNPPRRNADSTNMPRFVKLGQDVIDLNSITSVSFAENQSGISDKLIIQVAAASVIVDSGIVGKKHMDMIRERLLDFLTPEDWEPAAKETQEVDKPLKSLFAGSH